MAEKPRRVQLSRRKGWRMPENTVSVARPTKWGNPYSIEEYGRKRAILNYRTDLEGLIAIGTIDLEPLRGKNLACWCPLEAPCHARSEEHTSELQSLMRISYAVFCLKKKYTNQ